MYDVNGLPSTVTSTRRCASSGVTFTSAALEAPPMASTAIKTTPTLFLISGTTSVDHEPVFLEIALADLSRLLRGARLVGHRVQLHHRPSLEARPLQRCEHAGQIDAAPAQLDPAIGARGIGPRRGRDRLHVLEMEEEQPVMITIDGLHRIAAALRV